MMQELILDFSKHLSQAIKIGTQTEFNEPKNDIKNVLICGLGGSGISGTIISQLLAKECQVPISVNKDYHLPVYVNESTLVICSSYSGNTEETLMMYDQAIKKRAEICIITSGGKFKDFAETNGHNHIVISGGLPPRAAFGLAFPQTLITFNKYGLISANKVNELSNAIDLLDKEESDIQETAKNLANHLHGKIPVLYSESSLEGICVRFRQQINENSKNLCWHHVIPEMNHNEIVGWKSKIDHLAVVILRAESDFYRNVERINYLKSVVSKCTDNIKEVFAKGENTIERAIYLIHLGDWASYYLAELKGIDSVEVDVITGLKNMLADLD
ncbi:MAG: bifunctional phosphoglucose/phosphomannose isomerase [Verrucomicrobia bacterium]|nr:bifunctional phosphoglucose/phosphomannose isomerase [Verrucomicrobiota bacterium]